VVINRDLLNPARLEQRFPETARISDEAIGHSSVSEGTIEQRMIGTLKPNSSGR
jgi:hypothetical protein